jgi:RimJ/RimL family protein N-acetyltransferase
VNGFAPGALREQAAREQADGVPGVGVPAAGALRGSGGLAAPRLVGRRVRLRPLMPEDLGPLYEAELGSRLWLGWRQRGLTPSFEQWRRDLEAGSFVRMVAVRDAVGDGVRGRSSVVGVLCALDLDSASRHCSLAVARVDGGFDGCMGEAGVLFVHHLFRAFSLEKVYLHVAGYNEGQLGSLTRLVAVREGLLVRHELFDGRWWDLSVLAIHRAVWADATRGWLSGVVGGGLPGVDGDGVVG